jgi:DNA-binding LacI/PurR family transcriptional regulator
MEALAIAGMRVPEQISVVGCDDLDLSARSLMTIHVDLGEVGRLATNDFLDRIENRESGSKQLVVPVKLIIRETTAPPEHRLLGTSTLSAGSRGAVRR